MWHIEVPRPQVKSELQSLASTTATVTPDLSHICSLHHSSRQCWILSPLSKARDRTCNLVVPSQIHQPLSHDGNSWVCFWLWFFWSFCLFLLGPHLWHMEVPRLGVESELQLLAYTTATARRDPSHIYNLHHSSWQRRILNPLSEARDRTCNLVVPSQSR